MIARLDERLWFPDVQAARGDDLNEGLIAIGGDLSIARLQLAYRSGIFPWSAKPLTWWSPDPRAIFELDQFHASRSLERTQRRGHFTLTRNRAFAAVIESCAARKKTWIAPEFIAAYTALHRAGHAHSVECWDGQTLVGGVYGVAIGGLFAGESMFHRQPDASKLALWHLVQHLRERGFTLFDIQELTPITRQLGAVDIARAEYLRRLARAVELPCEF